MHGVLGGLRNMLRQWRINYLRYKRKKQKEIEEGKLVKYYSLKRILYSGLAVACYPFYLFHTPSKEITKDYPDLVKIEKEIQNLQNAKGSISIKKMNKKVEKIESKLLKIEKQSAKRFDDSMATTVIEQLKKEVKSLRVSQPILGKEVVTQKIEQIESLKSMEASHLESEKYIPIDVKEEKIELEKIKEKIDKIAIEMVNVKEYSLFYDLEHRLLDCRKKLESLQSNLQKEYLMGILSLMEYNKRFKPIMETLEQVENLEKQIAQAKKQILTAQPKAKEEVTIEKKKVEKESTKEKEKQPISEWEQARLAIMEQIKEQNKQLLNFQKQNNPTFKKKAWNILSSFANYTIRLLFSVTPFMMFKNKLLGTLTTTIMVNNSLKSMKKVLRPQENLDYEWLGNEFKEKKTYLQNIYRVSKDSLFQIETIKEDVMEILKSDPQNREILYFLQQLSQIEKATIDIHNRAKIEGNIIDKQFTKILTRIE